MTYPNSSIRKAAQTIARLDARSALFSPDPFPAVARIQARAVARFERLTESHTRRCLAFREADPYRLPDEPVECICLG